MFRLKDHYILSSILLVSVLIIGWIERKELNIMDEIQWSHEPLNWDNFQEVKSMEEDFHAKIYSDIYCPDNITMFSSNVYAFMEPMYSEKLHDSVLDDQLLIHEQYHFNITEYHARLLRKAIINIGKDDISESKLKQLYNKYSEELGRMQDLYDSITDHNVDQPNQRYWELKIDDLLRQTANYENTDIYAYNNFLREESKYYRNVYYTFDHNILASIPISEEEFQYGEAYEVDFSKRKTKVHFYKNGELTNGGKFNTAKTEIYKHDDYTEVAYYSDDGSPNTLKEFVRVKSFIKDSIKHYRYFNEKGDRVLSDNIYETQWRLNPDGSYYSTYYDINGHEVVNNDKVYHERRSFDELGRTTLIESFNRSHKLMRDDGYGSIYKMSFNSDHLVRNYSVLDTDKDFAKHLSGYNIDYYYNTNGQTLAAIVLNESNSRIEDQDGASIYTYTYDKYGNTTSYKTFNRDSLPVLGAKEFHQEVKKYNQKGNLLFRGQYYPENVLAFSEEKWGSSKYEYLNDSTYLQYNLDAYNLRFNDDNGIAIQKRKTNKKNEVIELSYLDVNENHAKTSNGISMYKYKYDTHGNKIEEIALDSLGNLKAFDEDVAKVVWDYDNRGNKTKTTYYNKNQELAKAKERVTYNIYRYNTNNYLTERLNLNLKEEPQEFEGVYRTELIPNIKGLDSVTVQYNKQNLPISYAPKVIKLYNEYDNLISTSYYDLNDNKVENEFGVHSIQNEYDEMQYMIATTYLDKDGRKTINKDGFAVVKYTYNISGYTLNESYFDKFDKPALGAEGHHMVTYVWNETGEMSKVTYYNVDLFLMEDEFGVAVYEYDRFNYGLIKSIKRYDRFEQPTNNPDGIFETIYRPNMNGLYYLEKELDKKGNEINLDDETN